MERINSTHTIVLKDAFTQSKGVVPVLNPLVTHGKSDGRFANLDTLIEREDYAMTLQDRYYTLGTTVSARAYMAAGGFNGQLGIDETGDLIRRICEGYSWRHPGRADVEEAEMVTSPRRLYHQIRQNSRSRNFWRTFHATEMYRTDDITQGQDISVEARDAYLRRLVVRGGSSNLLSSIAMDRLEAGATRDDAIEQSTYAMELGHLMFGGPSDLLHDCELTF